MRWLPELGWRLPAPAYLSEVELHHPNFATWAKLEICNFEHRRAFNRPCAGQLDGDLFGRGVEHYRGNFKRRRKFNGSDLERSRDHHCSLLRRRELNRRRLEIRNQLQAGHGEGGRTDYLRSLLLRWQKSNRSEPASGRLDFCNFERDLQIHRGLRLLRGREAHRDNLRCRSQLQCTHFEAGRQLHRSDIERERKLHSSVHRTSRLRRAPCGWSSDNWSGLHLGRFRHDFGCG